MTAATPDPPESVSTIGEQPGEVTALELAGLTLLPVGMMSALIPDSVGFLPSALLSIATMTVMSRGANVWFGWAVARLGTPRERGRYRNRRRRTD